MARGRTALDDVAASPAALDLRLADGTPADSFERLARAVDKRRVTISEAKQLADIIDRRLHVLDAERFRQRLEAAEARALAVRPVALPPPAFQAVIETVVTRDRT